VVQPCDFQCYCSVIRGCIGHWLPWALRPGWQPRTSHSHAKLASPFNYPPSLGPA
jgi:hypothetical protein